MSATYDLPMPNDRFAGGTVVASCYVGDRDALLLILRPESPFYAVAEFRLGDDESVRVLANARNVNEAVRQYADAGGDA